MSVKTSCKFDMVQQTQQVASLLDLKPETVHTATDLAGRVATELPVNGSPRVLAACSVYTAGLLCNDKVTQATVAEMAGVSEQSVRRYREIIQADDDLPDLPKSQTRSEPSDPGITERIRRWLAR